jgi:hypothetical protein
MSSNVFPSDVALMAKVENLAGTAGWALKFASVYGSFHNYFNKERHLVSRKI